MSVGPEILQLIVNGIFTASIYMLSTLGFTLVYSLERFPNIAHVQFLTFGSYIGLTARNNLGLGLPEVLLLSFISTGILGLASHVAVFKPLKKRGASNVHLIVGSVGFGLVLMFTIQQIFGRDIRIYNFLFTPTVVGAVRLSNLWIYTIAFGLTAMLLLHIFLRKTNIGKAIRATSNNPQLAMASGVNVQSVSLLTWFLGAALAGAGGVFYGANIRVIPSLGIDLLPATLAIAVLGGLGNYYGTLVAAVVLGLVENVSVPVLVAFSLSTDLRTAVAYILVILALVRRTSRFSLSQVLRWKLRD